jgi:hypothetical protein
MSTSKLAAIWCSRPTFCQRLSVVATAARGLCVMPFFQRSPVLLSFVPLSHPSSPGILSCSYNRTEAGSDLVPSGRLRRLRHAGAVQRYSSGAVHYRLRKAGLYECACRPRSPMGQTPAHRCYQDTLAGILGPGQPATRSSSPRAPARPGAVAATVQPNDRAPVRGRCAARRASSTCRTCAQSAGAARTRSRSSRA